MSILIYLEWVYKGKFWLFLLLVFTAEITLIFHVDFIEKLMIYQKLNYSIKTFKNKKEEVLSKCGDFRGHFGFLK